MPEDLSIKGWNAVINIVGRLGRVEEVAEPAAFLLSDNTGYFNGECITVDAGLWLAGRRMI